MRRFFERLLTLLHQLSHDRLVTRSRRGDDLHGDAKVLAGALGAFACRASCLVSNRAELA